MLHMYVLLLCCFRYPADCDVVYGDTDSIMVRFGVSEGGGERGWGRSTGEMCEGGDDKWGRRRVR